MDTTVADPLIGAILEDRYRVTDRVASGGMAVVYRAVDERLDRVVAVKIIRRSYADNPAFLRRFEHEAKIIAKLSHPNVVGVFDTGSHDGLPYLVMEFVNGRTLRDVLNDHRRLPARTTLRVMKRVLAALDAAHQIGLVHRDVKPENVLLSETGAVKVADFGLARAVEAGAETSGQLLATVAYVAPELVTDGVADARSDVYSAGIVLYELVTGDIPFDGDDPAEIADRHVAEDVPAPSDTDPELAPFDEIVLATTSRDPRLRPAHAGEMLARLRDIPEPPAATAPLPPPDNRRTAPLPVQPAAVPGRDVATATPMSPPPPLPPRQRSAALLKLPKRTLIALGAVAVVLLLTGATGWWLSVGRYDQAPSLLDLPRAEVEAAAEKEGFTVRFDGGDYSENVPKDTVLRQDPAPGERILGGGEITVTLSLGPERYTIPTLANVAVADATAQLQGMRLKPETTQAYSDTVAVDHVISVDPEPGTVVKPDTVVHLVVSLGQAPVKVPNVVGAQVADAQKTLGDAQLTVSAEEVYHDTVPAGQVISQTPEPDTGVALQSEVHLVVSKGIEPVEVPNVQGLGYEEAKSKLEGAGLTVERLINLPGGGDDEVFDQNPEGGTMQPKGTTVWLSTY